MPVQIKGSTCGIGSIGCGIERRGVDILKGTIVAGGDAIDRGESIIEAVGGRV